ncbi:MAG: glycosyltransferase family 39 protein [Rhizobiales bacterium]|nr:glycosyltransferase family 39 protein [Hyphomicrobiales bacterium]
MSLLPARAVRSGAVTVPAAERMKRIGAALLPFLILLAWTAAIRLPFSVQSNGDEYFYAVIADNWRRGGLPYVTSFDIKPPGAFLIQALVQGLFGTSRATIKGMEIVAVALAAFIAYRTLAAHASRRLAIWVAALLPIHMLAFDGAAAINMLLELPLAFAALAATLNAIREEASPRDRRAAAFLAGLAIGAAGMVRQTAVFEATAMALALVILLPHGSRLRSLAVFVTGAALPAIAFAAYFARQGHFAEMFEAVITLAMHRMNDAVIASYGDQFAPYLTIPGATFTSLFRSRVLVFLWCGAGLCFLHRKRILQAVPQRVLIVSALWLGFAFAGVVNGRLLVDYYLLAIVPPLLILAAAYCCHGIDVAPARAGRMAAGLAVAAVATFAIAERQTLFEFAAFRERDAAIERMAGAIRALSPQAGDRLLVLSRDLALYVETGLNPPVPVFHPTHLMAVFPTPAADPLGTALGALPRFVVIGDVSARHSAELPERYAEAEAWLGTHYRPAATIDTGGETLRLYERMR